MKRTKSLSGLKKPNAYDALGKLCLDDGNVAEAPALFKRAQELDSDLKYQYNYAAALYENGLWKEAQNIFENTSHRGVEEISERALCGDGVCSFYLGDQNRALTIADELTARGEDNDWIGESEIADMYFLCGEHKRHNEMYDNARISYYPTASFLAPYFYCLKAQGRTKELTQKYHAVIIEKDDDISDVKNDSASDHAKEDLINRYRQEKEEITQVYKKITESDWTPDVKPQICCIYGCYLIDCPRHQKI
jgi:tetratricopeptide (TPR) repeat protein